MEGRRGVPGPRRGRRCGLGRAEQGTVRWRGGRREVGPGRGRAEGVASRQHRRHGRRRASGGEPRTPRGAEHAARQAAHAAAADAAYVAADQAPIVRMQHRTVARGETIL